MGGLCIYRDSAYTGELGCWHAGADEHLVIEPYVWGDVPVHSFYTFAW